jgi:hypothetical protein
MLTNSYDAITTNAVPLMPLYISNKTNRPRDPKCTLHRPVLPRPMRTVLFPLFALALVFWNLNVSILELSSHKF